MIPLSAGRPTGNLDHWLREGNTLRKGDLYPFSKVSAAFLTPLNGKFARLQLAVV